MTHSYVDIFVLNFYMKCQINKWNTKAKEIDLCIIHQLTMSSITLTLNGKSSELQAKYFPPIDLSDGNYECGLINLEAWNSIHNVTSKNNCFYYVKLSNNIFESKTFKIKPGVYQIEDLSKIIKNELVADGITDFDLKANKNTLNCELKCSVRVNFSLPNSLGDLLGFGTKILKPNVLHVSHLPPNILNVNVIRVECNIIKGAYFNDKPVHTIHEFSPSVPPGYKIVEVPKNVIYFAVTVKSIHTLTISLIDQNNELINFRDEPITIRIHLRRIK